MDTKRLVLFVIFSMSILMLWDAWQRQHAPAEVVQQSSQTVAGATSSTAAVSGNVAVDSDFKLSAGQRISVTTDLYKADIETTGGDLRRLELLKHRASDNVKTNFVLLDDSAKPMTYVAQTGLIGADLPSHKAVFTSAAPTYQMQDGKDTLEVRLSWVGNGVTVDKVYTFHRNKYAIDVNYEIKNGSAAAITPVVYYQIVHDNESNQGSKLMPTFTGGTYYTEATKFKKLAFKDMAKEPLKVTSNDGWVGLLQHYFVSAWIPKDGLAREFYTEKLNEHMYRIGSKSTLSTIAPGASLTVPARLFSGPQTKKDLVETAPGLEYTVDYGWLKMVASPLFWVLSLIHSLVHNWGVAIILLTLLIKAAFYPLSAKSYRSMAQMRELAPRLESMKQKFGDDRQKMQQAMMELYKTEKINPMSGCLPILIQIPVFISLYWMLLGSIELRHAPFFGWIQDLSAVDPYYILPIIMGISMIIQTKLNPKPTDPIQAKVMTWMPVIFSVFFFFFPAGLVLYWVVNNIISIWQQWYVNKSIHAAALLKKSGGKH
ncbi:membrane protein insertase YidC [Methylotenera versatilis]|uniref:Membrane protein insertase YidC n=1 Tax=Methylotenera versatilis (strain 301) TaxID=666681 RepID=D7DPN7_METV0|nr:membrane protein insertase YidC [Methylotenera versatilis]ADI31150.1 membrane protein insertase, YidC/Oxa1 family domain containing protein [Methylotenera versatilis 301]